MPRLLPRGVQPRKQAADPVVLEYDHCDLSGVFAAGEVCWGWWGALDGEGGVAASVSGWKDAREVGGGEGAECGED